jgi:hypothetical protein
MQTDTTTTPAADMHAANGSATPPPSADTTDYSHGLPLYDDEGEVCGFAIVPEPEKWFRLPSKPGRGVAYGR